MALTFPSTMPAGGVDSMAMRLRRADYLSPEVSGRVGGVAGGWPLWEMRVTLSNTDSDETDVWAAWIDAQRGPLRLFLGRDLSRPYPRDYPTGFAGLTRYGGGSFAAGTATSWSVNGSRDVVTLNGLPPALSLRYRDGLAFQWTTGGQVRRSFHRFVEPGLASGVGVLTRSIEPPMPTLVPGGATATLANPDCLMRLIPGEAEMGETDVLHTAGGRVAGIQVLLP